MFFLLIFENLANVFIFGLKTSQVLGEYPCIPTDTFQGPNIAFQAPVLANEFPFREDLLTGAILVLGDVSST